MCIRDRKKLAPLKVYWQPGCSSCLKTKEFLLEHGVAFQSVNVLEDEAGFEEAKQPLASVTKPENEALAGKF